MNNFNNEISGTKKTTNQPKKPIQYTFNIEHFLKTHQQSTNMFFYVVQPIQEISAPVLLNEIRLFQNPDGDSPNDHISGMDLTQSDI